MRRDYWLIQLKSRSKIETATTWAVRWAASETNAIESIPRGRFSYRDLRLAADVSDTRAFVLRFFVFENALREVWRSARGRETKPQLIQLIRGFASWRNVPSGILSDVQQARTFRNNVVHGPVTQVVSDPLRFNRSLSMFLSHMPMGWDALDPQSV